MTWTLFCGQSLHLKALAFFSGLAVLQFFSRLPDSDWLIAMAIVFPAALIKPGLRLLAYSVAGFICAYLSANNYLHQTLPENLSGQSFLIEGQVSGVPHILNRVVRFNFQVVSIKSAQDHQPVTGLMMKRLKLSWYFHSQKKQQSIQAGQVWQLLVRLKPPHGSLNPGGFDYEKSLYLKDIHATGYVKRSDLNRLLNTPSMPSIDSLRQSIMHLISSHDGVFNGLIKALAVGDKTSITQAQWRVLIRTGTSHLMAISGLHIGLLAAWVFFLVRQLVPHSALLRIPSSQWAACLALAAALFYALLAGLAIPTQRAVVMLSVVMMAVLLRRQISAVNSLSCALIVVLLLQPRSVLSVGFYLSFLAVASIALSFSGRLKQSQKLLQWGRLQWVMAIALFPVSLLLFTQTSVVSPVANFIFVPLVSFVVVPLVLLAVISHWFYLPLAIYLFSLADYVLSISWPLLQVLSDFEFASWQPAPLPVVNLLLAFIGIVVLLMPRGLSHRWLGLFMLIPCLSFEPKIPEYGSAWIDVLDVGQGLASVVRTRHHTLVYDTGASYKSSANAGNRIVLPFLKHNNVGHLDKLIISHGDNDHIGGAASIIEGIAVKEVMGQDLQTLLHDNKVLCKKAQRWHWDGVDFEILHPDRQYNQPNNRACVLKIKNSKGQVLLTADIEARVERQLLNESSNKLKSDLMLVPHHGSKTSSLQSFIEAVNPRYAIVSSGYKNRFKHPRAEIINRYESLGVDIYNTAQHGNVSVKLDLVKGVNKPKSYRKQASHYWNHRL